MKANLKKITLISFLLLTSLSSIAGYNASIRKNCNIWAKYRLTGGIITHYWTPSGNYSGFSLNLGTDGGCGYAAVLRQTSLYNQFTGVTSTIPWAKLDVRIGSSPHYIHYSNDYHFGVGDAFVPPSSITGLDTCGFTNSSLNSDAEIVPNSATNTVITINNFAGSLDARGNFGSSYRVLVWKANSATDSVLTASKVVAEGSVRIENGLVVTTGIFSPSDFIVSTYLYTIPASYGTACAGSTVVMQKVDPIPGLQKTLNITGDTTLNDVNVTIASSAGFGNYDANQVFTGYGISTIPTISQWGLFILCLISLTLGVIFISKRKRSLTLAGTSEYYKLNNYSLFNGDLYLRTYLKVLSLGVIALILYYVYSGEATLTDTIGVTVSTAVIAYIIHHLILLRKK